MRCAGAHHAIAAAMAAVVGVGVLAACGSTSETSAAGDPRYPETGLVLLRLSDGSYHGSATVGTDPVAVLVSDDGGTAFLADSSPGDVYAVRLPDLGMVWKHHVGGAPFGLLMHGGSLFVSLFASATVVELDPASGQQLASHLVCDEPAVMTVDEMDRVAVACRPGKVGWLDGTTVAAGEGFGIALVGGRLWTAGYSQSTLVQMSGAGPQALPLAVSPFWLAPGAGGTILISAEGAVEDTDPGAVFSYDPMSATFRTLARPRDPDQVLQSGSTVFVAAHGDNDVLAIERGRTLSWAGGSAAVGLAADPQLNLLVVVVNAHE